MRLSIGIALTLSGLFVAQDSALRIPPGKAVEIDGKISDEEWADALAIKVSGSCSLRIKHDANALVISYTGFPKDGFACLFVRSGDDVKIFHASAQLGTTLYRKTGESWNPKSKDNAWKKADAMWKQEGWKASAQSDAGQEFAVSFKTLGIEGDAAATIAFGYVHFEKYGEDGKTVVWPDCGDACGDAKLLAGWNPDGLKFDFSKWARIKPGK